MGERSGGKRRRKICQGKVSVEPWIRFHERMFLKTRNPFFAWGAFMNLRGARRPLPEWLLAYFDDVAKAMLKLRAAPPTSDITRQLGVALCGEARRGRGAALLKNHRLAMRDYDLAIALDGLVQDGHQVHYARQHVADEFEVKYSTVFRAEKRYRSQLPR